MITPEEYYCGKCPQGGETICPKDKLSFDTAIALEPYVECPLHHCPVPLGVISQEEHDRLWAQFIGGA